MKTSSGSWDTHDPTRPQYCISPRSSKIKLITVDSIAREYAGRASLDVFLSGNGPGGPLDQSLIRLPLGAAPQEIWTI